MICSLFGLEAWLLMVDVVKCNECEVLACLPQLIMINKLMFTMKRIPDWMSLFFKLPGIYGNV